MKLETTRFGNLDIEEKQIIEFSDGLYGFEKETRFILLPFNPNVESPMEWMQSALSPHLAFVITDPYLYVPDYKLKLLEEDKKRVALETEEEFLTRSIVTIPENYTEMTANLVAPIVINPQKGMGKQFVLTSMEYDTRHYLLPEEMRTPTATPH
ncbi:MAG: flagellar assembly protein FliW [Nitrospina sp.]|jgi:flagellar assembly factor FliW|nr:flagellar assembly protein FliW [Nitrospina sp.]MBT5633817.1 flagellar assembly protein FliW [Nitrospina sp.]